MSKLIVVSDAVYSSLKKVKSGESFSKAIAMLLDSYTKSSNMKSFAGALKDADVKEWLKEIEEGRKMGFKRKAGGM